MLPGAVGNSAVLYGEACGAVNSGVGAVYSDTGAVGAVTFAFSGNFGSSGFVSNLFGIVAANITIFRNDLFRKSN